MLELLGSGYVIDYCVSAFLKRRKDELYRAYITDALKYLANLNIRYTDILKPAETRTSDEIISGIKAKLNKYGGDNK